MNAEERPPERLLTARQVAALLAVDARTVFRMSARGELPRPIRFNSKVVRWSEQAVRRWVRQYPAT
jgi:predicted DNA-binding transcriptional regulator AlpA